MIYQYISSKNIGSTSRDPYIKRCGQNADSSIASTFFAFSFRCLPPLVEVKPKGASQFTL